MTAPVALTRKDFQTNQEVRWCPGCGDYAILAQFQKVFPTLGVARENMVIVSGIGCSSRFPYYMNTYGFHTIHGRAPAFATGLKCTRPDLQVWVITGDGDALSIGGNQFIHAIRRNVDLKIILFNNRIYGLTKGQYSPTSEPGKRTKSTPYGSLDEPFRPLTLALGCEATFVARSADREQAHLGEMIQRAAAHKGTAFVEVLQNCNIFNDGAFFHLTEKDTKNDNQLVVEHGKPLLFGKGTRGVVFDGFEPRVVEVAEVGLDKIHVHDERGPLGYHVALSHLDLPTPFGVLRSVERPTYDALLEAQIAREVEKKGAVGLDDLLTSGETWTVG